MSLVASVYHLLLSSIASAGDASSPSIDTTSDASTDSTPLFLVTNNGPLSAVLGYLLSLVTGDGLLSTIFGYLLSSNTSNSLLSPWPLAGFQSLF